MKKWFEIFIILFGLYIVIYLILYISYLDGYCNKKSQNVRDYKDLNLILLKECKESFFCEYDYDNDKFLKGKLIKYYCRKDYIRYYEKNFYIDFITNIIK